jgi:hypothetical protein
VSRSQVAALKLVGKESPVDMAVPVDNSGNLQSILASKAPAGNEMLTGPHWFFTLL